LSASKLSAVLPHVVEEHILEDTDACVMVAAAEQDDSKRQIMVVQRDWLKNVTGILLALGAHHLQVLPGQLCLQARAGELAAAVSEAGDITLHLSAQQGVGWLSSSLAPVDVLASLRAVAPQQTMALHVPAASVAAYLALDAKDVVVLADSWPHWISAAQKVPSGTDLIAGMPNRVETGKARWHRWRWPLRLAAAVLLLNIVGLNLQWWQLAHEAKNLREDMGKRYRAAYPDETVIVDPLAQTRQKIALAEQAAGKVSDDSFIALASRFGSVWNGLHAVTTLPAILTLDYRDGALLVRFAAPLNADVDRAQVQAAFANASLRWSEVESGGAWKIGSRK
jgi:general secretion pathway protein L